LHAVLKAHKVKDFTVSCIDNALIPILRVQDLDGFAATNNLKYVILLVNLELALVDLLIDNFNLVYLFFNWS
jgi:hypothetical protein